MLEAPTTSLRDTPPETRPETRSETRSDTRPRSSPRLWLGPGQRLWLDHDGKSVAVRPVRCFPWSAPGELVSLRDSEDREHYLVEQPAGLDHASAAALQLATESAGFVLEIEAILGIEEDYEVRVWRARTRH